MQTHVLQLERQAKPTLTPVELDVGDTLSFTLNDGRVNTIRIESTSAEVLERNYAAYHYGAKHGDISAYAFAAVLEINGTSHFLRREVGTQESFYEPWKIEGMHLWLDAVADIFQEAGGFMLEKDISMGLICKPYRRVRLAVQDSTLPICPEPVAPWCPLPAEGLDIHNCYNGEDCWMGPYGGGLAHCGLDINMPSGTVLRAPIAFDDHYCFHTLASGANNNRWRGIRRWPDGSEWWLQAHHLNDLIVPDRTPLAAGTPYAHAGGVHIGAHEHAHFVFRVIEQGGDYFLDPWLLFAAMSQQPRRHATACERDAPVGEQAPNNQKPRRP